MYISKKHITIFTGEPMNEYGPKLYLDWFVLKANLKRHWCDSSTFQFRLGLFSFHLCIILEWGFVERERNEKEEEIYQRAQELRDLFNGDTNE